VQSVNFAPLAGGEGPSRPGAYLGEALLNDHIIQTEIAPNAVALGKGDQERHDHSGGEGDHPQQAVQRHVFARAGSG